ncbi:hypothetical protein R80B4_01487 [Fibrobacteres bacterium R8-0-B4]
MLTETKPQNVLDVPESDSEYPIELVEQWLRNTEITKLKIASGEIKIKSVREQFIEHGFKVD